MQEGGQNATQRAELGALGAWHRGSARFDELHARRYLRGCAANGAGCWVLASPPGLPHPATGHGDAPGCPDGVAAWLCLADRPADRHAVADDHALPPLCLPAGRGACPLAHADPAAPALPDDESSSGGGRQWPEANPPPA
jgi:hypothetical protein